MRAGPKPRSRWAAGSVLALVLAAAFLAAGGVASEAAEGPPGEAARPRRVVIVSMPGITWEDVESGAAPNLASIARRGAVGALSIRTVGPYTDLASSYATLGAGNRTRGSGPTGIEISPSALPRPGGGLEVRQMMAVRLDNAELGFQAVPGALGEVLHKRGLRTGIAGNADGGLVWPATRRRIGHGRALRRYAGLALADRSGHVDAGRPGNELSVADAQTLNGYRSDPVALAQAAREVIASADVTLVELADAYREGQVAYARFPPPDGDEPPAEILPSELPAVTGESEDIPPDDLAARLRGVRRDDALLGTVASGVDLTRDSLIVVGTTGLGPAKRERLTVAVLAGVGARPGGWLTSATTLRTGLITLSDVAPGVLRLLGAPIPSTMTGQPFRSHAASPTERVKPLLGLQARAMFQDRWVATFFGVFVAFQGGLYLIAWRTLRRGFRPLASLRWLALAVTAVPLSIVALPILQAERWRFPWPMLAALAVTAAIATAAALAGRRTRPAAAPTLIFAATAVVIAGDLVTGAHLQLSTLIGYSPIVAGRFYGLGNLSYSILATTALMTAAYVGATRPRRGSGVWLAGGIVTVAVLLVSAPSLGADFGGVLALIPAGGVLLLMLAGRRISWTRLALLAIAAVAVAAALGVLDSLRPPEVQTHIGRFLGRLLEQGPSSVAAVIARKARATWTILTRSLLTLAIPVGVAFLPFFLRQSSGRLRSALLTEPGMRAGLWGVGLANLLGAAVNDSGLAIAAMGLSIILPYALATVLRTPAVADTTSSEPVGVGDGGAAPGRDVQAPDRGMGPDVPSPTP